MENIVNKMLDRREFLRSIGRYTILGGLISVGGFLVTRHKIKFRCPAPKNRSSERLKSICSGCTIFSNCDLPLAKKFRLKTQDEGLVSQIQRKPTGS